MIIDDKPKDRQIVKDIIINDEKLIKLTNDEMDIQLSIEASQEMIEEKIKIIEERINKEKQKTSDIVRKQKMKIKGSKLNCKTSKADRVEIIYVLMG